MRVHAQIGGRFTGPRSYALANSAPMNVWRHMKPATLRRPTDPLRPARGILTGAALSAGAWVVIAALVTLVA